MGISNRHLYMSLAFRSEVLHDINLAVKGLCVVFKAMGLKEGCED